MPDTDHQLLLAVHRGDDDAARTLWAAYAGTLRAYAGAISPAGADDVVQGVFCKILERPRAELAAVQDVPAWLVTMTRREAVSWLRRERREAARRSRWRNAPSGVTGIDVELEALIAELPRQFREIVVLRHVAGLSLDRAAAALGVNHNTLAWRYARAIELLRDKLRVENLEASDATR